MHGDNSTPAKKIETETAKTQGLPTRRRFLAAASIGIGHAALGGRAIAESSKPLKVKDVVAHFLSRSPWVNRDRTVDRVIIGDPEKQVNRCVVTWMPSFAALRFSNVASGSSGSTLSGGPATNSRLLASVIARILTGTH